MAQSKRSVIPSRGYTAGMSVREVIATLRRNNPKLDARPDVTHNELLYSHGYHAAIDMLEQILGE